MKESKIEKPMLPAVLRMSLKKKWFEMTKAGIKTEDYREINDYWIKRLVYSGFYLNPMNYCVEAKNGHWHPVKEFSINVMTLGYPSNNDTSRIIKLEHKGIEVRKGKPEWGAEPNKLYFVILHGAVIS